MRTLDDITVASKRVLIREDLNVPLNEQQEITSFARIEAALPSIKQLMQAKAKVIILSHLGRPEEGVFTQSASLAPVAQALSKALNTTVTLVSESQWSDGLELADGQVCLLENIRFSVGESANDKGLSARLAALCDVFVMDAFAVSHRAQASTVGVAECATEAVAGPLLTKELSELTSALTHPEKPLLAIIGGSKVSTKFQVLENLLARVDSLIVGGGMANTFLAAQGYPMGKSLYEPDWVMKAKELMTQASQLNKTLILPVDIVVAQSMSETAQGRLCDPVDTQSDEAIFDVGPQTQQLYKEVVQAAKTIIWNGPVGVFEFTPFAAGTKALSEYIAASEAFSLAGGGDTLSAIEQFGIKEQISAICTGGGAFLEWMEGKVLPGIAVLERT